MLQLYFEWNILKRFIYVEIFDYLFFIYSKETSTYVCMYVILPTTSHHCAYL